MTKKKSAAQPLVQREYHYFTETVISKRIFGTTEPLADDLFLMVNAGLVKYQEDRKGVKAWSYVKGAMPKIRRFMEIARGLAFLDFRMSGDSSAMLGSAAMLNSTLKHTPAFLKADFGEVEMRIHATHTGRYVHPKGAKKRNMKNKRKKK